MSAYTKQCGLCGKTFQSNWKTAKYCSDECKYSIHKARVRKYKKVQSSKPAIVKECKYCGAQYNAKRINQLYCTRKCYEERYYQRQNFKGSSRECEVCGRQYDVNQYNTAATCSNKECVAEISKLRRNQFYASKPLDDGHLQCIQDLMDAYSLSPLEQWNDFENFPSYYRTIKLRTHQKLVEEWISCSVLFTLHIQHGYAHMRNFVDKQNLLGLVDVFGMRLMDSPEFDKDIEEFRAAR